jgi:hypothetical protein
MHITIETLILVSIRGTTNIFQGMWGITQKENNREQHYFFRCEASNDLLLPTDLEITELYALEANHIVNANYQLVKLDAMYLLKYALLETINLMDTKTTATPIFSSDQNLEQLIVNLAPQLSKQQLLALPDEIGFAASIDFTPQDNAGIDAAQLLFENSNLH